MATAVVMPRLSDTMTEGKILKWHKKEGDPVKSGEAIADVETDKATLELEVYEDGTLLKIVVGEGQSAPLGAPVAIVGKPGEDFSSLLSAAPSTSAAPSAPKSEAPPPPPAAQVGAKTVGPKPTPPPPPAPEPRRHEVVEMPRVPTPAGGRVKSSPLARRMARESGVDLSQVVGSGPGGRVVAKDIEEATRRPPARAPEAAPAAAPSAARRAAMPPFLAFPEQPAEGLSEPTGMRRVIATRMGEVWSQVPHFFLVADVDMESCVALREELKELGSPVSLNDFVLKAAAIGLRKVPEVNRSYLDGKFQQHGHADVGMAVALPDGLVTPVLHDVDLLPLGQVAALSRDYAERARSKRLKPEEYSGGSVTVSNLGMFGVDHFFAVINPPQSAILAVGKVQARPVVWDGQVAARQRMWLSLSGDHRAIDGALGARYLAAVREALERPVALMV